MVSTATLRPASVKTKGSTIGEVTRRSIGPSHSYNSMISLHSRSPGEREVCRGEGLAPRPADCPRPSVHRIRSQDAGDNGIIVRRKRYMWWRRCGGRGRRPTNSGNPLLGRRHAGACVPASALPLSCPNTVARARRIIMKEDQPPRLNLFILLSQSQYCWIGFNRPYEVGGSYQERN